MQAIDIAEEFSHILSHTLKPRITKNRLGRELAALELWLSHMLQHARTLMHCKVSKIEYGTAASPDMDDNPVTLSAGRLQLLLIHLCHGK